jgi:hypothetical protein
MPTRQQTASTHITMDIVAAPAGDPVLCKKTYKYGYPSVAEDARTSSKFPRQKRYAISIASPRLPFSSTLYWMTHGTTLEAFLTSSAMWTHESTPMRVKMEEGSPTMNERPWVDQPPEFTNVVRMEALLFGPRYTMGTRMAKNPRMCSIKIKPLKCGRVLLPTVLMMTVKTVTAQPSNTAWYGFGE